MRLVFVAFAALWALGIGCRSPDSPPRVRPSSEATAGTDGSSAEATSRDPVLLPPSGRVHAVRGDLRFVVVDYTLGGLPTDGSLLGVYRNDLKVGELRLSGPPERSGFVTADILDGFIQVDDEVRVH